jgi:hypothetical protein
VSKLVPSYEKELKAKGADLFGNVTVQCAPTGGPEVECLVQIPYRRLQSCATARGSVFVESVGGNIHQSSHVNNGQLDLYQQICYIGPNGEPVPSKPNSSGSGSG